MLKLVGLDVGTTSVGAVVLDASRGRIIRTVSRPAGARLVSRNAWEQIQDAERIWDVVQQVIAELQEDIDGAEGIGVTGQMHGIVYLDTMGNAVSPLFSWEDGRGDRQCADGRTYCRRLQEETGLLVKSGWGLVTHAYHVGEGLVPPGAVVFCTMPDYIAMKISGQTQPVMGPTLNASLGYALTAGEGADELDRLYANMTAQRVPDRTLVGRTSAGVPVWVAIGDNQASFLGAITSPETSLLVNIGTGSQLSVYLNGDDEWIGQEVRPFFDGGCLGVQASPFGGGAYAGLLGLINDVVATFGGGVNPISYEQFDAVLALERQGSEAWQRRGEARVDVRSADRVLGLSDLQTASVDIRTLATRMVASMASEIFSMTSAWPESLRDRLTTTVAAGNTLRRNPGLRGALAASSGRALTMARHAEEAAVGAALYAGYCSGVYGTALEAMAWMGPSGSDASTSDSQISE